MFYMLKYVLPFVFIGAILISFFSFISRGTRHLNLVNANNGTRGTDTVISPAANYLNFCSGCHGEKMDAFVDRIWKHDSSRTKLFNGIKFGYLDEGMPAFDSAFTDEQIFELTDYIIAGIKNVNRYITSDKPTSNIFRTSSLVIRLDTIVTGLDVPWSMAFLPRNEMLIADRNGKLYYRKESGALSIVTGSPEPIVAGQGGLLDIALDPDYKSNHLIYLSYSKGKKDPNS